MLHRLLINIATWGWKLLVSDESLSLNYIKSILKWPTKSKISNNVNVELNQIKSADEKYEGN